MSEVQTVKIRLKEINGKKPNSIEFSFGNKSIRIKKDEIVEIPLLQLQTALNTERFEQVIESDLPDKLPFRKPLEKAEITFSKLSGMSKEDLIKIPGIAEKSAEEIINFLGGNN